MIVNAHTSFIVSQAAKVRLTFLAAVTLVMCMPSLSNAAAPTEDHISMLFARANAAYDSAMEHEGEAREKELRLAAANYEKIIKQGRIENGYLYYNLGNAYYHLGELGKAIVNYRRAERLLPNFPDLRENLRTAIGKRKDKIEKRQIETIWQTLFFWHFALGFRAKVILFAVCFVLIWLLLLIKLFRNGPALKWGTVLAVFLSMLFAASFTIEAYSRNREQYGVITAKEVDAKKAPYTSAESEFTNRLHEGTEFKLIEERAGWYWIRLDNGSTTWVPKEDCEII